MMQKLISELRRLYLLPGAFSDEALERRVRGEPSAAVSLAGAGAGADGLVRALVIPFPKVAEGAEDQHWSRLCEVASVLQQQLGLPAPGVSIDGDAAYGLWLSLAEPVEVAEAQRFLALLRAAYFADVAVGGAAADAPIQLPPCVNAATGRWAAFIHPGMGASFAEEAGLEMPPPVAGQVAFLEGLKSISAAQFAQALQMLQPPQGRQGLHAADAAAMAPHAAAAAAASTRTTAGSATPEGLLLKDASLEDIVRHLHALNIEPTFRHLIPK
jgi:hypothetical protein